MAKALCQPCGWHFAGGSLSAALCWRQPCGRLFTGVSLVGSILASVLRSVCLRKRIRHFDRSRTRFTVLRSGETTVFCLAKRKTNTGVSPLRAQTTTAANNYGRKQHGLRSRGHLQSRGLRAAKLFATSGIDRRKARASSVSIAEVYGDPAATRGSSSHACEPPPHGCRPSSQPRSGAPSARSFPCSPPLCLPRACSPASRSAHRLPSSLQQTSSSPRLSSRASLQFSRQPSSPFSS
jgi:hypothetical protein